MEAPLTEKTLLVVESSPEHTRSIQQAFQDGSVYCRLEMVTNGLDAIDFLNRRGNYSGAPRPDLVLLDLNLPGKDGREVLAEIKAHSHLRRIPIVVLTLSDRVEDILTAYSLQGNCYVIKSTDIESLVQIVKRIEEFWLGIVTLPVE